MVIAAGGRVPSPSVGSCAPGTTYTAARSATAGTSWSVSARSAASGSVALFMRSAIRDISSARTTACVARACALTSTDVITTPSYGALTPNGAST